MISQTLQQLLGVDAYQQLEVFVTSPIVTIVVLALIVLATIWKVWSDHKGIKQADKSFEARLMEFSSFEKLMLSLRNKKEDEDSAKINPFKHVNESNENLLSVEVEEPRLRSKLLERSRLTRTSLLYITSEERAEKKRELEQIQMQKIREAKRREEEERRAKQQKKKAALQQERSENQQKQGQQITSNQAARSNSRKTTIQKVVEKNQGIKEGNINQASKLQSIFNNPIFNKSTIEAEMGVEQPKSGLENQKEGFALINLRTNIPQIPKIAEKQPATNTTAKFGEIQQAKERKDGTHGFLFSSNLDKPKESSAPQKVPEPKQPTQAGPSTPLNSSPSPAGVPVKLSTSEYFEQIMKFAESQRSTAQISTIMANLGGAESSLSNVLISAQSLISSINKSEDAQQTTFALKLFDSIIYQIKSSNARDGLYQIPPKSKTSQAEKNAINRYALTVNLYRLMGYEKIWMIVFGKTLRLLEFTYKRQHDIKKLTDLDLLINKHMDMVGEVEPKYLSRIDYLTYFLMGLLAFDPISVYRQVEEKDPGVRQSREEIQNFGREWSYKQFWIYLDLVLKNKHQSYFKPVLYMNILSSLFSKILENKKNPSNFRQYALLYQTLIELSKRFFGNYDKNSELKALRQQAEGPNYIIDGDNMIQMIKPLNSRLCIEKFNNFNQKSSDPAKEFEAKENIFYYFCKER